MAPSCYSTLISIQETLTFMPGSSLPSVFPWTSSCDRGSRAVWISSSVALGSRECICGESVSLQSWGGMGSRRAWSWGQKTVTASWMEQKLLGTPRASALHVPPQPTSSRVSLLQPCFFGFCPSTHILSGPLLVHSQPSNRSDVFKPLTFAGSSLVDSQLAAKDPGLFQQAGMSRWAPGCSEDRASFRFPDKGGFIRGLTPWPLEPPI